MTLAIEWQYDNKRLLKNKNNKTSWAYASIIWQELIVVSWQIEYNWTQLISSLSLSLSLSLSFEICNISRNDLMENSHPCMDWQIYHWCYYYHYLFSQALKQLPREKVQVATKFGIIRLEDGKYGVKGTPDYVRECCEASLKRLDINYIDLYYQHRIDLSVPIEDTVRIERLCPPLKCFVTFQSII